MANGDETEPRRFVLPSIADFPPEVQKKLRGMADAFLTDKMGGPRDNPPLSKMRLLAKHEYLPDAATNLCKACVRALDDHVLNPSSAQPVGPGCRYIDDKEPESA